MGVDVVLLLGEAGAGRFTLERGAERVGLRRELIRLIQKSIPRVFQPDDVKKDGFLEKLRSHFVEVLDRSYGKGCFSDVRLRNLGWC
ncbi:MAG: hypothetical protein ACYSUM_18520 [Planctomycetota bacterium]